MISADVESNIDPGHVMNTLFCFFYKVVYFVFGKMASFGIWCIYIKFK